jgi:hypothetical protein
LTFAGRPHKGQQSKVDCINRPDRRLLPTNANTSNSLAMREPSTEDVHRSGGGNCAPESERGPRIADASGSNTMALSIVIDA